MGLGSNLIQALLYLQRVTIDRTYTLACTATEATFEIPKPGGYVITNMGPDPVNIRMFPNDATYHVTLGDFVLFPVGSGDRSSIEVVVANPYNAQFKNPKNVIHAICGFGKTAELKITHLTEQ